MKRFIPDCGPIFTIGHSTRPSEEFLTLLKAFEIKIVIDVRTIPRSRHNPQFNEETLSKILPKHHIRYVHLKGLGGLRKPHSDSQNMAWKNAAFRGFADYMGTEEFGENLCDLIDYALKGRVIIMCAETLYWRCHRSLISDALLALGLSVKHVLSINSVKDHTLTPWAKAQKGRVHYPG